MADFLHRLARGDLVEEKVALVAAHPDDEVLGLGSCLARLPRLTLIHLTDGAPRGEEDLQDRRPCPWRAYAATREEELRRALAVLGADRARRLSYGYPDQQAIDFCAAIVDRLVRDLAGVEVVITHPYEHGHPDHDTAALAVSLACERLRRNGRQAPAQYEFASYHLRDGEGIYGAFWSDPTSPAISIQASEAEIGRKRAAIACFASQRAVTANFPQGAEQIRRAPRYDFRLAAPPGDALYDLWEWAITSAFWRERTEEFLAETRSEGPAWA